MIRASSASYRFSLCLSGISTYLITSSAFVIVGTLLLSLLLILLLFGDDDTLDAGGEDTVFSSSFVAAATMVGATAAARSCAISAIYFVSDCFFWRSSSESLATSSLLSSALVRLISSSKLDSIFFNRSISCLYVFSASLNPTVFADSISLAMDSVFFVSSDSLFLYRLISSASNERASF